MQKLWTKKNIFMDIISNVENIKQYNYDEVLCSDFEISINTNNAGSKSSTKETALQSNYFKGITFETNVNIFIEKIFDNKSVIELPSLIFTMEMYNDYKSSTIKTMKDKIN